ncbi:membrane protein EE39 [Elephant endotheliotropic herpesvirus 1A]|nr:membrane protein EE39 [Elephant endotheliotropic herpesvirus 1A]
MDKLLSMKPLFGNVFWMFESVIEDFYRGNVSGRVHGLQHYVAFSGLGAYIHADKTVTSILLLILSLLVLSCLGQLYYKKKRNVTMLDLLLCMYGLYFSSYSGTEYCGDETVNVHCRTVNDVLASVLLMFCIVAMGLTLWMKLSRVPGERKGICIKCVRTLSRRWIPVMLTVMVQLDWKLFRTISIDERGYHLYIVKETTLLMLFLLLFFVLSDMADNLGFLHVSGFAIYFYFTVFVFYLKHTTITFYVNHNQLIYSDSCLLLPLVLYPVTRLLMLIK